jgi:hypothetical protein
MRKVFILLSVFVLLGIISCTVVGTLYPISENWKDYVFKKEMPGKWGESKDSFSYYYKVDTLPHNEGKLYRIEVIEYTNEGADTTPFRANLINLQGWYFLDCWYDLKKDLNDFMIAKHFIMKLSFPSPDEIELSSPMPDQLIKLIDQKKVHLNYLRQGADSKDADYGYLIIDKPKYLRFALEETKKYPKLYKEKTILYRLK